MSDSYYRRITALGDSTKDRLINVQKEHILRKITKSPNYEVVYLNNSLDRVYDVLIFDDDSRKVVEKRKVIIMNPDDAVYSGDLVTWRDETWICIESEFFANMYYKGIMLQSFYNFRFYDNDNVLIEFPFVINKSILDYDSDSQIDTPVNKLLCVARDTPYNRKMKINTRVIIGFNVYVVEAMENVTQQNIINYRLNQVSINEKDDFENNIAWNDWYEEFYEADIDNNPVISMSVLENPKISQTINATAIMSTDYDVTWQLYDADGINATNLAEIVSYSGSYDEICEIKIGNLTGAFKIKCWIFIDETKYESVKDINILPIF